MTCDAFDFRRGAGIATAHVADACLRLGRKVRMAPPLLPVLPDRCVIGCVRPVRHFGSVDVFLEAIAVARAGEILVIDNDGRHDEGCIGDLVALEATTAGIDGIIVWGRHRDSAILRELELPVFSLGACPSGPVRLDPRTADTFERARVGPEAVTDADIAVADDDGVVFLERETAHEILTEAQSIRDIERRQVESVRSGSPLRDQLRLKDYIEKRGCRPEWTFRDHLKALGAVIET